MKKLILVGIVSLLAGSFTRAEGPLKTHPDSSAWTTLFATDLSNALAPSGVWSWKDGILSPKEKDEVIWTKTDYENFTLDLEFKLETAGNSGVVIYNTDIQNWPPNAIEIQLLDDGAPKWANIPANWKCGGIFGHSVPLKSVVKKPGEWNRMTIRCHGPRISSLKNHISSL